MAVRKKRRRRIHRETVKSASTQKSIFQLIMAILALFMVLSFGDQFATSAAGCYGAISEQPAEENTSSQKTPEDSESKSEFKVKTKTD